jgi:hypothetical protein
MSVPDPSLKTHTVNRDYVCIGCGHEATIESKVLAPGVIGWIEPRCASCAENPVMLVRNH